jgi:hypothetical protein
MRSFFALSLLAAATAANPAVQERQLESQVCVDLHGVAVALQSASSGPSYCSSILGIETQTVTSTTTVTSVESTATEVTETSTSTVVLTEVETTTVGTTTLTADAVTLIETEYVRLLAKISTKETNSSSVRLRLQSALPL